MLSNLMIGIAVMVFCLLIQVLLLLGVIHYYAARETRITTASFLSRFCVLGMVLVALVLGNLFQTGVWALVFRGLGEFTDYATAFYHSAVNFSTLGYGDLVMSEEYRLLGPVEAINGGLMIGVSTAVFIAAFQDALKKTVQARGVAGAGRSADR